MRLKWGRSRVLALMSGHVCSWHSFGSHAHRDAQWCMNGFVRVQQVTWLSLSHEFMDAVWGGHIIKSLIWRLNSRRRPQAPPNQSQVAVRNSLAISSASSRCLVDWNWGKAAKNKILVIMFDNIWACTWYSLLQRLLDDIKQISRIRRTKPLST